MGKKILVTGGAGFIGSHLCDRLISEGNDVICLDNLYTGSLENINHLLHNSRFQFIEHDITNPIELHVDEIYNFACPASPVHYQADAIHTFKTSILGAINVLELAKKTGAKVLQASTSEVYGDPLVHPQPEAYWGNVNPIGIRSCYDEGKRGAETIFFDFVRQHNVKIKIVRIFNTYGPRMNPNDGRVVSNFIMQALKNKDLTVYGSGKQTRSFCYVDDLVNGIVEMMNSKDDFYGPVNLGNPCEFTMNQLADKVIAFTESNSKVIFHPLPQDDPQQRKPDISLAKEKLNWEPTIILEEGLSKTIQYFRKIIERSIENEG